MIEGMPKPPSEAPKKLFHPTTTVLIEDRNRILVELLLADADLAMTFIAIAETGPAQETTRRNIANASKAYDDICKRRPSVGMSPQDAKTLRQKLDKVREGLRSFGQSV